jgi:DNA-directed RNA polymerase subunit E"
MAREMACRKCKRVTTEKVCPGCKSSDLTPDWSGVVLVVDPTNSEVSKTLAITQKGKYAIKVT